MGNEVQKTRVTFDFAYHNAGKNYSSIKYIKDGKEDWSNVSQAVYNWAISKFEKGEEVEVEYTLDNKGKMVFVRMVKINGGTVPPPQPSANQQPDKAPEENKSVSNKPKTSANGQYRAPEQITRDEVGLMVAKTTTALAGFVDVKNIDEVVKKLYKTYLQLVTE